MKPVNKWTVKDWFVAIAIVLFVLWNPLTRQIVLFLLPLGSGVDDFVFLVVVAIFAIVALVRYIQMRKEKR